MKKFSILTTCLITVVLFTQSIAFAQGNMDIQSKVDKLLKEFSMAQLQGTTEQRLSFYTDDAISLPSYQPMEVGIAAIKKADMEYMKSGMKFSAFELSSFKILTSGNLVTDIGTYKLTMSMPGSDKTMDDHGKYLTVFEKQKDGSLKIKVETWNSDLNPMDMMKSEASNK